MLVEALARVCSESGVDQIFSVLLAEDERDAEFLASCGFDEAGVRVLSRRVG
jgi:N-acetylglutamate synthase-like GNAT family acetyltransferase